MYNIVYNKYNIYIIIKILQNFYLRYNINKVIVQHARKTPAFIN